MRKVTVDEKYGGGGEEKEEEEKEKEEEGEEEGEAATEFRKKGKNRKIFLKTLKVSMRDHGLLLGVGVIPENHIFSFIK